jgi:hypothetical protein
MQLAARVATQTGPAYTAGEIQSSIQRLQAIALPDGTVTALISRDAEGKLRLAGV